MRPLLSDRFAVEALRGPARSDDLDEMVEQRRAAGAARLDEEDGSSGFRSTATSRGCAIDMRLPRLRRVSAARGASSTSTRGWGSASAARSTAARLPATRSTAGGSRGATRSLCTSRAPRLAPRLARDLRGHSGHQIVRVVDQLGHERRGQGPVENQRVPVLLVQVVSRRDRREATSQERRSLRVGLQADHRALIVMADQCEHPACGFEDERRGPERRRRRCPWSGTAISRDLGQSRTRGAGGHHHERWPSARSCSRRSSR
jgi:hypothetical protein